MLVRRASTEEIPSVNRNGAGNPGGGTWPEGSLSNAGFTTGVANEVSSMSERRRGHRRSNQTLLVASNDAEISTNIKYSVL